MRTTSGFQVVSILETRYPPFAVNCLYSVIRRLKAVVLFPLRDAIIPRELSSCSISYTVRGEDREVVTLDKVVQSAFSRQVDRQNYIILSITLPQSWKAPESRLKGS